MSVLSWTHGLGLRNERILHSFLSWPSLLTSCEMLSGFSLTFTLHSAPSERLHSAWTMEVAGRRSHFLWSGKAGSHNRVSNRTQLNHLSEFMLTFCIVLGHSVPTVVLWATHCVKCYGSCWEHTGKEARLSCAFLGLSKRAWLEVSAQDTSQIPWVHMRNRYLIEVENRES